jgi:hypothetical protein
MHYKIARSLLFIAFSALSLQCYADPKSGFGVDFGIARHGMTPQNGSSSYSSAGISLGLDYQIALSRKFSLNPFLMTSGESSSVSNVTIGHGIAGLELRYWADNNMFFGGHLASYSEVQTATVGTVTVSASGSGTGVGLVAGWENPRGGFFAMGQVDAADISYSGNITKMNGVRLSIGYRWK